MTSAYHWLIPVQSGTMIVVWCQERKQQLIKKNAKWLTDICVHIVIDAIHKRWQNFDLDFITNWRPVFKINIDILHLCFRYDSSLVCWFKQSIPNDSNYLNNFWVNILFVNHACIIYHIDIFYEPTIWFCKSDRQYFASVFLRGYSSACGQMLTVQITLEAHLLCCVFVLFAFALCLAYSMLPVYLVVHAWLPHQFLSDVHLETVNFNNIWTGSPHYAHRSHGPRPVKLSSDQ